MLIGYAIRIVLIIALAALCVFMSLGILWDTSGDKTKKYTGVATIVFMLFGIVFVSQFNNK
jgi:hypothetical protein